MRNNIPSLDLRFLEYGITITVSAVLNREADKLLLLSIIAIHLADDILHLNTICTDILNS